MIMTGGALSDLFRPALFDAENRNDPSRANKVFLSWTASSAVIGLVAVIFIGGSWLAS